MFNDIFKDNPNSTCIKVYLGKETVQDPYEKNVEVTLFQPTIINAIVEDLSFSQIKWKLPGIITDKAKRVYISKKYRTLIENSQKIEVKENGIFVAFEGWRVNGRMQIREEGDLLQIYIYVKSVD